VPLPPWRRPWHFIRYHINVKRYVVNTEILAWIECFLTGRSHKVKINSVMSDWYSVISGIPQGRVLGPLLMYYIYINDLLV